MGKDEELKQIQRENRKFNEERGIQRVTKPGKPAPDKLPEKDKK